MHWGESKINGGTEKSSTSLAEILNMKQETEEVILKEIQLFQSNSNLSVKGVELDYIQSISGKIYINSLKLQVEL